MRETGCTLYGQWPPRKLLLFVVEGLKYLLNLRTKYNNIKYDDTGLELYNETENIEMEGKARPQRHGSGTEVDGTARLIR